jgi:hypothetical protein
MYRLHHQVEKIASIIKLKRIGKRHFQEEGILQVPGTFTVEQNATSA